MKMEDVIKEIVNMVDKKDIVFLTSEAWMKYEKLIESCKTEKDSVEE